MKLRILYQILVGLFIGLSSAMAQNVIHLEQPDELARFPGCEKAKWAVEKRLDCATKAMLKFVYKHLKYPKEARRKGLEGFVVVRFLVDEKGFLSNIQAVRDLGLGTSEEVERVFGLMNEMEERWIPAKLRGKPIVSEFNAPIAFKLD